MSVLIAEAALLVLLIGISAVIIVDRRLMSSVITYCAFSFAAMLLYTIGGDRDGFDRLLCDSYQIHTKKARDR